MALSGKDDLSRSWTARVADMDQERAVGEIGAAGCGMHNLEAGRAGLLPIQHGSESEAADQAQHK